MFRDMTFCQERKCSFFPSCERAWTRELEEEARKYEKLEVWFFSSRPLCFDKGLEELDKVYEIKKGEINERDKEVENLPLNFKPSHESLLGSKDRP